MRPESGSARPGRSAAGPSRKGSGSLRRLEIVGVVLPIAFIVALELIRFRVVERSVADYGFHAVLALAIIIAVVAFSFVMFRFIERAQTQTAQAVADLERRQREGQGLYDVLLRISNQNDLADILAAVADQARDQLGSDAALVCLNGATTRFVQLDSSPEEATSRREGVCIVPAPDGGYGLQDLDDAASIRSSAEISQSVRIEIQAREKVLGDLWIGRRSMASFTERDRQFLETLSDLASIAITGARMRESEQQAAILAERERIARELHDSLAQVLGVTHLRLRALTSADDVGGLRTSTVELTELADLCEDGYRDVREAILDLRESSRTDRDLLDDLRAYLDKYSRQCGVRTSLETTIDRQLTLPPRSEIQIIRVVQEALTNVRKHSEATSATVRIRQIDGAVSFVVDDNGRGFDPSEALLERDGFGLHSMRERIELIGGTLVVDSAPGRGTRVVAEVPGVPMRTPLPVDAHGAVT